ncbi:unnamed protein product [Adineta ricciae]|uniref:Uncharacterized protein n=1 Tax=Adineta ricciae TaxID=249248 RepID=A0A816A7J3_ADIRI|nr:unnamed protein product [Adineta ricciae]
MEDDQSINKTDDYDVVKMDNILDGNDPGYGLMHVDDDENSAPRSTNPTLDPMRTDRIPGDGIASDCDWKNPKIHVSDPTQSYMGSEYGICPPGQRAFFGK